MSRRCSPATAARSASGTGMSRSTSPSPRTSRRVRSRALRLSGEEAGQFQVKFDVAFTESDKKGAKPTQTIKGTLEVTCAPKK